jgi:hypothetical protein
MHRIGGIPNNCKFLWIQANAELARVQLLFLGASISPAFGRLACSVWTALNASFFLP